MVSHYGEHNWPAESKLEIILGAILVQNTNWEAVQRSLDRLKNATAFDAHRICQLDSEELQDLIRPSGFYRNKSKTIQAVLTWMDNFGFDYQAIRRCFGNDLRQELLKLHGIGNETADVLLVYVFDLPKLIADSYARKLFDHLGIASKNYQDLARQIVLPVDFTYYKAQIFHGLIDEFGKQYFRGQDTFDKSFLATFNKELKVKHAKMRL